MAREKRAAGGREEEREGEERRAKSVPRRRAQTLLAIQGIFGRAVTSRFWLHSFEPYELQTCTVVPVYGDDVPEPEGSSSFPPESEKEGPATAAPYAAPAPFLSHLYAGAGVPDRGVAAAGGDFADWRAGVRFAFPNARRRAVTEIQLRIVLGRPHVRAPTAAERRIQRSTAAARALRGEALCGGDNHLTTLSPGRREFSFACAFTRAGLVVFRRGNPRLPDFVHQNIQDFLASERVLL